ncbi:MAG: Ig-like domain-containing protein [Myxococcota bacterium]
MPFQPMSGLRLSCVSPVSPVALVALVALAVGACAGPPPEAAPPASPAVRSAALSQGCDCADGSWDVVDQGSAATLNVSGKSLCIDSGTFSGQLQMDAATRVCVDDDAAFVSPQALNLGGRFENWGVAGTALTPFSFSAVEGTVIDNHGAMHIATANFNGRADITNAVDATIDFTTSFSLRNRSTMTNRGTFRAVSNFDTSADSVFVNEGYGYITGQLSFEGVSENHGLLEITAKVNVNGTAAFANTCTIVSHGTYNVNGAYANDGLVYLTADSEDVVFNVTGGGSMTQGASGTVFVTSADGVLAGPLHANLRVDGGIRGGGQIYVEDETVCQGSGVVSGTPEAPMAVFDATPTGLADGRLLDIQTGTLTDVVRGPAPVVPTLLEAQLGVTGSDCRTLVALHCYDDHPPTEIDTGCDANRPWCDVAGEVRRCVACKDDLDCGPGHLCLDGLCENPDPIARDDHLAVAEGGSVAVSRAALGENDANIDIVTLALPGGVTALATLGGGSVVATTDGFSYTPAAQGAPAADTFRYAVCGVGTAASICVEAVVTIAINHRPTPGDLDVWVAVGTATVDVDVVPAFSDPDGDGPAADVGVETLAVPEPLVPGVRTVEYTACDDGVPSACGAGEVTVHVNDPPVLGAPEVVSGGGHTVVVPRGAIILGTGVVHGDDARDGDTDGIGSIVVSGPCALNAAGDLAVTLPPTPGSYGCVVIVCEELPPGSASVCATTTVPIVVADPPLAIDDLYWGLKGVPVAGMVAANDVVDAHGAAGVVILGPAPDPAAQGSVAAAPSGLVTFTPVASFAGSVKVVYRLSDGLGQSDTATITFIVNDPPVLAAPTVELPPAGHGAIPLAEVITGTGLVKGDDPSDGDTDGLGSITVETGANVCALVGSDIALTAPTGPGHFTCRLRVCEELPLAPPAGPGAACSTTTITVVVPGATPPVAGDDAFYGAQGASLGGSVLGNDAVDTVHGGAPTVTVLGPTPRRGHRRRRERGRRRRHAHAGRELRRRGDSALPARRRPRPERHRDRHLHRQRPTPPRRPDADRLPGRAGDAAGVRPRPRHRPRPRRRPRRRRQRRHRLCDRQRRRVQPGRRRHHRDRPGRPRHRHLRGHRVRRAPGRRARRVRHDHRQRGPARAADGQRRRRHDARGSRRDRRRRRER